MLRQNRGGVTLNRELVSLFSWQTPATMNEDFEVEEASNQLSSITRVTKQACITCVRHPSHRTQRDLVLDWPTPARFILHV